MTPDEVERVLPAARAGDGAALEVLWRVHQPRLVRFLRGRGVDDPEDVATQVWIDAARNLQHFRGGPDDFRRWLFTIAHRRVVDERRRLARRRTAESVTITVDDRVPGADVAFEERDALARALRLVAGLPVPMRDVVLLRIVADLDVRDTAEVMGLQPGHVRVLLHRAMSRLEQMLHGGADGGVVTLRAGAAMKPPR